MDDRRPIRTPERPCEACGVTLPASRRYGATRYCSPSCRSWHHHNPGQQRPPYERQTTCEGCGGPVTGRQIRFCTAACRYRSRYPLTERARVCEWCKEPFTTTRATKRHCTDRCARAHSRQRCKDNGYTEPPRWNDARKARYQERRARKKSTGSENVSVSDIYERDGWRCQLCRRKVDPAKPWPDPWSASLDHIVPLSEGGRHAKANVQLAHLRCNVSKGNRGSQQLRLVG